MIWQSIVWAILALLVARVPYGLHDRLEAQRRENEALRADVSARQEKVTALYLLYRELP